MLSFFLNLLFPPLCLHCQEVSTTLFCVGCAASFELIDPHTRCPYCFKENGGRAPCLECKEKKRWHVPVASALDFQGPVETLIKRLKFGSMPYLAKTAAAFMQVQYEHMGWEMPDLIVPVPHRLWFQGTNTATLLAKAFAKTLDLPVCEAVGRRAGDFSQTQRERLSELTFILKKQRAIEDKVILLIDDVLSTGTALFQTTRVLKEGLPKKIYALTLARSMH